MPLLPEYLGGGDELEGAILGFTDGGATHLNHTDANAHFKELQIRAMPFWLCTLSPALQTTKTWDLSFHPIWSGLKHLANMLILKLKALLSLAYW